MDSQTQLRHSRLPEQKGLTGARGLAALFVFFFHILGFVNVSQTSFQYFLLQAGYTGVDFFFVLSAYLLSMKIIRGDYDIGGKFSYARYMLKRIFRIWPLYWCVLIAIILLGSQSNFLSLLGKQFNPLTFFFLANYLLSTFSGFSTWSLQLEELFYLVLPLWVLLFLKGRWKISIPLSLFIALAYSLLVPSNDFFRDQFPRYVFDYALGTLLAISPNYFRRKWIALVIPPAFLCASFLASADQFLWWQPVVFALLYSLVIANYSNSGIFANRVSEYLGKRSYAFYLVHGPVIIVIGEWINYVFYPPLAALWIALSLGVSLILAELSYRYVERPFINIGQNIYSRILEK